MPRLRWTEDQRAEAVRLYSQHGAAEAARRSGIPLGTVKSLAKRAGVATGCIPSLEVATAVAALTLKDRRYRAAHDLHDVFEKVLAQLDQPCKEHHWGTVSEQEGRVTRTQTVWMEHEIERPTFAAQKTILAAAAIALDRSLKLTGDDQIVPSVNVLVQVRQVLAATLPPETQVIVAEQLDRIDAA